MLCSFLFRDDDRTSDADKLLNAIDLIAQILKVFVDFFRL